jgi:hypothetical protein
VGTEDIKKNVKNWKEIKKEILWEDRRSLRLLSS